LPYATNKSKTQKKGGKVLHFKKTEKKGNIQGKYKIVIIIIIIIIIAKYVF